MRPNARTAVRRVATSALRSPSRSGARPAGSVARASSAASIRWSSAESAPSGSSRGRVCALVFDARHEHTSAVTAIGFLVIPNEVRNQDRPARGLVPLRPRWRFVAALGMTLRSSPDSRISIPPANFSGMAVRPASKAKTTRPKAPSRTIDWRAIAYHTLVSRALDDAEETTNRNRASVPREHLVLYQFSARGHDMAQTILGSMLDHPHDGAGAYYRSRPLLLSLGLSIEDALASPLGRSGGFSDGRDIGVVCNLCRRDGPIVLPMSGDVGSQYTPCAGWAQSIRYHADVLGDASWDGAIGIVLGGEASVATNGFWSALTMATTLSLPMLFYVEDNGLGISVRGGMQTPGGDIAKNLASFANLFVRDGDGTNPAESAALLAECVDHVRDGRGPAL